VAQVTALLSEAKAAVVGAGKDAIGGATTAAAGSGGGGGGDDADSVREKVLEHVTRVRSAEITELRCDTLTEDAGA